MRLIVVSQTGYGLGIASHLSSEGHHTDVCVGMEIPQIQRFIQTGNPDIVVCDTHTLTAPAEWARTRGIRVLGPTKWSSLLETDSDYSRSVIRAVGYNICDTDTKHVIDNVIVSCWFNGQRFISKSIVFNHPRMMAGDIGTDVGCAGYNAYFNAGESRLVSTILEPLEKFLRKANHRGAFSIECAVTQDGQIHVSSISGSMNKPYSQAIFENTRRSKSDIIIDVLNEASKPIEHIDPCVVGVMLSVYPYPHAAPVDPLEIVGLNTYNLKHIWKMDFDKVEGKWLCGQLNGCIGYVTARGRDHFEAFRRVRRTISNVHINDIQYRNDIGKDVGEKIHKLRKLHLI